MKLHTALDQKQNPRLYEAARSPNADAIWMLAENLERELAEARKLLTLCVPPPALGDSWDPRVRLAYVSGRLEAILPCDDDNRPVEAHARKVVAHVKRLADYTLALHHELTVLHDAMRLCDGRTDPPYHKSARCKVVSDLLAKNPNPADPVFTTEASVFSAAEASGAGGAGTTFNATAAPRGGEEHEGEDIARVEGQMALETAPVLTDGEKPPCRSL